MKPFFNNKTFLISMGTGIPESRDFSIDAFKKSIQLGANVISVGIALHDNQIVLKPENYNKSFNENEETISLENLLEELPSMLFNFIILERMTY